MAIWAAITVLVETVTANPRLPDVKRMAPRNQCRTAPLALGNRSLNAGVDGGESSADVCCQAG